MRTVDIIRKKRDGGCLAPEEISSLIQGYSAGAVPDYQMASFLMAVYNNGMRDDETMALTQAMLNSGSRLDLSGVTGIKIDKHSTGGVGDKTSIILATLMAAMGLKVPMIAGRGLGHTGGTIDKLASIPGLSTEAGPEDIRERLKTVGCSISRQSGAIAPADKKIYALRDATATVESIPLIAASIMSKKLAESLDALLLDVKTGSGALTKDIEGARKLARLMVDIGNSMGVKTAAVITDMDAPLGRAVGNSLEVKECVSALKGKAAPDLMEVTLVLAAWALHLADSVSEEVPVRTMAGPVVAGYKNEVFDYLEHADAFKKFAEFVDAQGGDPEAAFKLSMLPAAKEIKTVESPWEGYIRKLDAFAVGHAAALLGGGRDRMEDDVDLSAGILINKKPGDKVAKGELLATLHTNDTARLKEAGEVYLSGIEITERDLPARKLILDVVV